jgi:hypothetical protein
MTIKYKNVPNFPGYCVGDDGSVWSRRSRNGKGPLKKTWHRITPCVVSGGYHTVTLYPGQCQILIHRLVLETFVGDSPGMQTCHANGNRTDNRLSNLRWGTALDNAADKDRHGNTCRGTKNGNAILDQSKVVAIRNEHAVGGITLKKLGAKHGVTLHAIWRIVHRKNWRHV